jgi:hypothetical protein
MLRYERQRSDAWEIFEAPTILMLVALIREVDAMHTRESYTAKWLPAKAEGAK